MRKVLEPHAVGIEYDGGYAPPRRVIVDALRLALSTTISRPFSITPFSANTQAARRPAGSSACEPPRMRMVPPGSRPSMKYSLQSLVVPRIGAKYSPS